MPDFRPYGQIISLATAIGLLTASCAPTKFYQCKRVLEIAAKVNEQVEILCGDCQVEDSQEALQVADVMETSAQEMGDLEINDEQLQTYQSGFVELYQGWSQATRDFVEAFFNQKDLKAAQSAKEKLQQFGGKEKEIVDGINNYCQTSEQ